jgi:hypothetical protein
MTELSEKLISVIDAAEPKLRELSEQESETPVLSGGWSRKQVLGHLIDSASNNHQRFVRAVLQESRDFPGYDQAGNVRLQAPQEADWNLLITLWASLQSLPRPCDSPLARRQTGNRLPHRIGKARHAGLRRHGLSHAPGSSSQADWRCRFSLGTADKRLPVADLIC